MHMHLYTSPEGRERIRSNEELRGEYGRRRYAELEAAGVAHDEAERIIGEEIDAGAAMQSAPVTITRTVGGGDDE